MVNLTLKQTQELLSKLQSSPTNKGFFSYINIPFFWDLTDVAENPEVVAQEIIEIFESQAGVYPYWFGTENGLILVAAIPNKKCQDNRTAKNVIVGLDELSESDAVMRAESLFGKGMADTDHLRFLDIAVTRLYDNGFVLCKKTDKEAPPT